MKNLNKFYSNEEYINMFEQRVKRQEHQKEMKRFFKPIIEEEFLGMGNFHQLPIPDVALPKLNIQTDKRTRFIVTKETDINEVNPKLFTIIK